MEKNNPTKMDASVKEKGNPTKWKWIQIGQGKRERKNHKNLEKNTFREDKQMFRRT